MNNKTLFLTGFAALFTAILSGYILVKPSDKGMYESSVLASVHLLSLVIGLSGVFLRGIYLRSDLTKTENLRRLFAADNAWGVAAVLWIATGLLRAFGGFDKGADFYIHNPMFHMKLGLFGLVFILEIWPMVTFIRWRRSVASNKTINFYRQNILDKLNFVETILIIFIVFVAGFMSRGIFM